MDHHFSVAAMLYEHYFQGLLIVLGIADHTTFLHLSHHLSYHCLATAENNRKKRRKR